jgi:hypothetical protein
LAARGFGFGADFVADETEELRNEESEDKNGEDPEVGMGEPVEFEAFGGEGPEESGGLGLKDVHDGMKKGGDGIARKDFVGDRGDFSSENFCRKNGMEKAIAIKKARKKELEALR